MDRPPEFRISYGHPLANGLVFAGLGRFANSTHYRDSSFYGNHGTLTNMAVPATATSGWAWDNFLGRWVLYFDGNNDKVVLPDWTYSATGTWSFWIRPDFDVAGTAGMMAFDSNPRTLFYHAPSANNYGWYQNNVSIFDPGAANLLATGVWTHIALVWKPTWQQVYKNGVAFGAAYTKSLSPSTATTRRIGARYTDVNYFLGPIADLIQHDGVALSPSEISALADPSNAMLSGLILPPARRLWGSVTAAPLTVADDSFENASPFDQDEVIGTASATGGTAPYTWEIVSQTLL